MSTGRLPDFTYLKPQTIEDACSLLDELKAEATVLAGGTELLVRMKQRLHTPRYLISLNGIKGIDSINYNKQSGLTIGSLTILHSLANSPIIRERYKVLSQAVRQISAFPLHYMSTVGGNICIDTRCIFYNQSTEWRKARPPCFKRGGNICHAVKDSNHCHSVYQGDLAPTLIALGAKVKISRNRGERIIPLNEFYTNSGENPNVLQRDEVVTEIQLPPPNQNSIGLYQKLRIREALDFPLAAVAVVLDMNEDWFCQKAKFVLGAVAVAPIEVSAVERILTKTKINNDLIEEAAEEAFKSAHPVDNLSIEARYRRKMIRTLTRRALQQVLSRKRGQE